MNGEVPTLPNQQLEQPEKKGLLKGLVLLEVGLIEFFFVAIVLILLFGILNYFNILRLSELFPNQLGFLPHRAYQQSQQFNNSAMKQSNNVPIVQTISSTQQAKKTLIEFLPTILNPSVIPQSSDILLTQEDLDNKQRFSALWKTKDGTASTLFVVNKDSLKIYQLQIWLSFTNSKIASIDLAQETIPQFVSINPKGVWGCKSLSNGASYCENFWEEENSVKQGVGLAGAVPRNLKSKSSYILFCQLSKQSSIYSWKSCNAEFAKTGILTNP